MKIFGRRVAKPGKWYGEYHRIVTEMGWRGGYFDADDNWASYNIDGDREVLARLGFRAPRMYPAPPDPPGSIFLGDLAPGGTKTVPLRGGH